MWKPSRRSGRSASGTSSSVWSSVVTSQLQHPDRDAQRHPDEQAGDQVALHRRGLRGRHPRRVRTRSSRCLRPRPGPRRLPRPALRLRTWIRSSPRRAVASPPSAFFAAGLLPEPLKSVAYQPLPLSWKPAADTSLTRESFVHAGQATSGASENFCSASSSWPQRRAAVFVDRHGKPRRIGVSRAKALDKKGNIIPDPAGRRSLPRGAGGVYLQPIRWWRAGVA